MKVGTVIGGLTRPIAVLGFWQGGELIAKPQRITITVDIGSYLTRFCGGDGRNTYIRVFRVHECGKRVCPHRLPVVCSSRSSSWSSSTSLPVCDHSGGVCECSAWLLVSSAPSSVCEFCCDSSSSIVLSFLSCLQVRDLLVLFFLVFRKKVHEQITYRESGITPLVIVVFVIKIMNWSLRSRNLFVKCPWPCSRTDHQMTVYNWWLVIQIMIRSWSDHHFVINNPKMDIPRDPVHDQIMNTWSDKFDHVDHDPLGDFRPLKLLPHGTLNRAFISLREPLFFMKISWKFHEKLAFHFISFLFISQLSWNGGPNTELGKWKGREGFIEAKKQTQLSPTRRWRSRKPVLIQKFPVYHLQLFKFGCLSMCPWAREEWVCLYRYTR